MRLGLSAISSCTLVGIEGSLLTSFSHGLTSPMIFYLSYIIYKFSFTRRVLLVKGSGSSNPMMLIIHFVLMILSLGVPPRISFFSEFFSRSGVIRSLTSIIFIIITVFYFSGFYMFYFYVVAAYGERIIEGGNRQPVLDLRAFILSISVLLLFFLFY
jgi:NADH:ubiquinone oxidoreductase subunit 4 (subunit M)